MEKQTICQKEGSHRYFIADTYAVEAEGKFGVIVVCTSCGNAFNKAWTVSAPYAGLKGKTNGRIEVTSSVAPDERQLHFADSRESA